jgi:hypothetical protein
VQLFSGDEFTGVLQKCLQHLERLLLHFNSYARFAEISLVKVDFVDPEPHHRVLPVMHGRRVYHFFLFCRKCSSKWCSESVTCPERSGIDIDHRRKRNSELTFLFVPMTLSQLHQRGDRF